MRLWHQSLIPALDNNRLSDLHMTCCNLRGNGWFVAERNPMVSWVVKHPLGENALVAYHFAVLREMGRRNFNFATAWMDPGYCGKNRPRRMYRETVMRMLCAISVAYSDVQTDEFLWNDILDLIKRDPDRYSFLAEMLPEGV